MKHSPYDDYPQRPMVRWYQPMLLVRTGIRALLATSVGQISDNRELQVVGERGTANVFDYSGAEEFWMDYVADIGDGWQATYPVASVLARSHIDVAQNTLPRGDVLIFGGDEVYPAPTLEGYLSRTFAPYDKACQTQPPFKADVFALPGNHDWYDGLRVFEDLFCHDDADAPQWPLGHWRKRQEHSYFSLKLPHGWWLLGADVQLEDRLNPSQRTFFRRVAEQLSPGDKIILCSPSPTWIDVESHKSSSSLEWLATLCEKRQARLTLVLAGDIHHYSRYHGEGDAPELLTVGGGGAFLHPTHSLPDTAFHQRLSQPQFGTYQLSACFPSKTASWRLSLRNVFFPILNWELSLFIGFVYTFLVWMLETRLLAGDASLSQRFEQVLDGHVSMASSLARLFTTLPQSPEFALVMLVTTGGLIAFNGSSYGIRRVMLGVVHTLFHMVGLIVTYCIAVEAALLLRQEAADLAFSFLWFLFLLMAFGGGVGGVVFGVYLIISQSVFGANVTNAFSALRITDFRSFARLHINAEGQLIVYPLGIRHADGDQSVVELIEPPIRRG